MKDVPYRSLVGSLLHLARCTRPDISAAVCILAMPPRGTVDRRELTCSAALWPLRARNAAQTSGDDDGINLLPRQRRWKLEEPQIPSSPQDTWHR